MQNTDASKSERIGCGLEARVGSREDVFQQLKREVLMMKQTGASEYKAVLMARREEILGSSRHREDIWIVQSHDLIDTIQLASDREFAIRTLERESKSLMQVNSALKRIDHGEFGICLECEEPISDKRLTAVPWAAYCLHCQELHDTHETADDHELQLVG